VTGDDTPTDGSSSEAGASTGATADGETNADDDGPRIRALDQRTIDRIAAGEVVERPASVVKELVENALDADADRVEVAVENGGVDGVRVRDDGIGMTREEAKLAVDEHTTSKIADIEDLEAGVGTLGFRGEALHTIGAVSRLILKTRPRDGDGVGTELRLEGGEVTEVGPAGVPAGTIVAVEDLFFNTPARRKFLKSRATEFDHVNSVVTHYALANPDVAVSLEHDGREVFATEGRGSLESTVLSVYGREVAESMIPVDLDPGDADADESGADQTDESGADHAADATPPVRSVSGLVSHPETTRSGRQYLSTFVNGRYVTAGVLRDAVLDAYGGQLAPDRYPFAVLFVEVPPDSVDVNVHPRKMEVRFDDEAGVTDAVSRAVREALLDAGLVRSGAPRGRSAPDEAAVRPGDGADGGAAAGSPDAVAGDDDAADVGDDDAADAADVGSADATTAGRPDRHRGPTHGDGERGGPSPDAADAPADPPTGSLGDETPEPNDGATSSTGASGQNDARGRTDAPGRSESARSTAASDQGDAWEAAESWSVQGGGRPSPSAGGDEGSTAGADAAPDSFGADAVGSSADVGADAADADTPTPADAAAADPSAADATTADASDEASSAPRASRPGDRGSFRAPTAQRTLDGDRARSSPSFDRLPSMRVLGQAFDTYLVAETGDGLVLIDQHAADERVNYERLREAVAGDATAQSLATPVELELTARETALFDAYVEALRDVGFRAERAGDRTVAVTAVPAVFDATLDPELLRDALAGFVGEGDGGRETVDAVVDDLLADLACYPSITGNTSLREGSVVDLLEALDDCENPYACPHGRPVIIRVDRDEIEDRFERDYPGHAGRRRDP